MTRNQLVKIIDRLFKVQIKGQIQIDFCGDGQKAKFRFTNISIEDVEKMERIGGK